MKTNTLRIVNAGTLIIMFYVTYLSIAMPLGGRTTAELSDRYVSFFTPAGFTFMIWNVIYLGLLSFVIYSFTARQSGEGGDSGFVVRAGWLFSAANLLNAGWLFAWHYNLVWLSIILMIALLAVLIRLYLRLEIGLHAVSLKQKIFVHAPFRFYLGWISVATVANFSAFFISLGAVFPTTFQQAVSVAMMLVVICFAFRMVRDMKDGIYPLVIAWALFGIGMKYLGDPRDSVWIGIPALVLSGVALLIAGYGWKRSADRSS